MSSPAPSSRQEHSHSPTRQIARKEFVDMLRDGRVRIASVILGTLVLVSIAAGYTTRNAARIDRNAAQQQMQDWWYKQPAKNAHRAAHYGLWAFKPAPILGFVDRGVDAYTGSVVWLEAHKQNDFRFRPAMDATATERFGEWTAAAVLQQLVPLLIIVLAFNSFAGERESGTLRQLASVGVPSRAIIAGKALGVSSALALILIPTAFLGSAALIIGNVAIAADVGRFAGLALLYMCWFALVLVTTMAVSIVARNGRQALLTLLGLWAFNSLAAPRVVASIGRTVHPTPSRTEFQNGVDRDLANGLDGHSPSGKRADELEQRLFAQYGVTTREALPISFEAAAMQASEEHGNEVFDAHYAALYNTYRLQLNLQQWLSLAAPMIAVRFLSMDIAGTDVEQHRSFATAAEAYRRLIARTMNGWLAAHTRDGHVMSSTADPALWAQVPPFVYEIPPLANTLNSYGPSIAALVFWTCTLAVWLVGHRRLSVD